MSKLFIRLYNYFKNRRTSLFLSFTICLVVLGFLASKIDLQENMFQMLPHDKNSEQLATVLQDSKFSDRIVVAISQKDTLSPADPDQLLVLADSLVINVQNNLGGFVESINYETNDSLATEMLNVIDAHLPVFLDSSDYLKIDSLITKENIARQVENNYRTLTGPSGIGMQQFILRDPLGLNFIGYNKLRNFQVDEQIELYDGHYLTKNHYNLLLFIQPKFPSSETAQNAKFFEGLDQTITQLSQLNNKCEIIYFGAPAVAAGNAKQIRADIKLTMTLTVILLLLILVLFFRKLSAPFLIMIPVVFGALFALAVIFLVKGSISVIAVGAGSLILGIAVNYSIHFLTHHRYHPNIPAVLKELAFPLTAGSLTTIGGFLCLQFVNAPVLQDLGLFAALSLSGAALATLVFLPHFISGKVEKIHIENNTKEPLFHKAASFLPGPKVRMIAILLITPFLLYFAGDVEFETDMYKVNYMSPQLKESEIKMNRISSYYQKAVFMITKGNSLEDALIKNEKLLPTLKELHSKGTLLSYTSVSTVLPSEAEQQKRLTRWNKYWTPGKRDSVFQYLNQAGTEFHFKESAFTPFLATTVKSYEALDKEAQSNLQKVLLNNFIEEKNGEVILAGIIKTRPEHTEEINSALSGFQNTFIFDRKYVTDKLMSLVNEDFNFITLWTSLLVLIALFLIYGRIELALISFIPMVVSWIWILGLMALLDIKFNIINIVLSTFIFALGDDFCIFTTDGLQQSYARKTGNIKSLTTSIALSAITTIIGMGVLIFASHPALNSIAFVSIIGILSVWVISQTLQPFLFNFFITRPTSRNHEPYTFYNILKSIFGFSYFIFGSLLISVIGIILLKLIPFKSPRIRYAYHYMLSAFARSMIYVMTNVKKSIINDPREDFSKPAVIIANHSSFLDILVMVMLHPKLILVTNKWVWNSPVFGIAVRLAEYYPVAEGAENTIPQLSAKVAQGYSVVIFPEGTRSPDGKIGRFHKGAFYLAEQLKLDILPIIIHGAAHTVTKGFFYVKNGHLTLNILPRIKPDDHLFGNTYQERSKLIRRYFIKELSELSHKLETPAYFKNHLFSNFLFKGPVLEWYMKIKVRLENNYQQFVNLVPEKGKVLDIGCGYGFLCYMLGYTSQSRTITGIDYDEDKIAIAQNGFDKQDNTNFIHADAMTYEFEDHDTIILTDVLHYLKEKDQVTLLEKCIRHLNSNGLILIREGAKELTGRHWGTRISELFSTSILGFNKTGHHGLHFISSQLIEGVASRHGFSVSVIDSSKLTSNIIFVLKKRI